MWLLLTLHCSFAALQTFHRRSYALRDADPHIVLVHYFDEANKTGATTVALPSAKGLKRALPNASAVVTAALAPQSPFRTTLEPRAEPSVQEESVDTIMNGATRGSGL